MSNDALNKLNVSSINKRQKGAIPFTSTGLVHPIEHCKIVSNSVNTFSYGTAVKLVGEENGILLIEKATANNDAIFGFIPYDFIVDNFNAGEVVPVMKTSGIITLEANGSIPFNSDLMIVPTGDKVAVLVSPATKIGKNRQSASANGDLIDVELKF